MNDKFNCQIVQITNGFLVQRPGMNTPDGRIVKEPETIYCADKEQLIAYLQENVQGTLTIIRQPKR